MLETLCAGDPSSQAAAERNQQYERSLNGLLLLSKQKLMRQHWTTPIPSSRSHDGDL